MSLIAKLMREYERGYQRLDAFDGMPDAENLTKRGVLASSLEGNSALLAAVSGLKAETLDEAALQVLALMDILHDLAEFEHDGESSKLLRRQADRLAYSALGVISKDLQIDPDEYGATRLLPRRMNPWQPSGEFAGDEAKSECKSSGGAG